MKKFFAFVVLAFLFLGGCEFGGNVQPKSEREKTLYVLGAQIGISLENLNLSADELKFVLQGIKDKATGQPLQVSPSMEYSKKIHELMEASVKEKAKVEEQESAKWLSEMEKLPGAKKQNSGLIYIETSAGKGKSPEPSDFVKVFYRGTLRDGKVFDSNIGGEPVKFPLSGVIPCWTEALQLMKVGGKATIFCPSSIAYGFRGAPPQIPGGAALKFEIELLGIEAAPSMKNPHDLLDKQKNKK